ncbi:hypothetical protein [Poseidonocella sedimentorum]|uniref:Uncharacterized protein n=1 Tax=Poseidonocella sedimentorum TaxID=871652 RepID=A0A1I6DEP9_9RHOB|nr:hypothetical protein [Poseidonocella sedimentorum]SFR03923.1 hypothetical protein SAMN04515673_10386 [Poseidonocella sedimentorum]
MFDHIRRILTHDRLAFAEDLIGVSALVTMLFVGLLLPGAF